MQQADRAHSATDALASSGNLPVPSASRRGMIAALAALPIAAIALPAVAASQGTTPFQRSLAAHQAAEARFNALPDDLETNDPAAHAREEESLSEAWQRAVTAQPADWLEFTQLLGLMTLDGAFGVDEDNAAHLMRQARRLLGGQA